MFEAGPDSDLISQTITKYVQRIWNGSLTVEEGLQKAQNEIDSRRKTEAFE